MIILTTIFTGRVVRGGIFSGTDKLKAEPERPYALHLSSSSKPVNRDKLPPAELFKGYRLYTTEHTERGKLWHRLRLGFFPTKKAAALKLKELKDKYPRARVVKVTKEEQKDSVDLLAPKKNKLNLPEFITKSGKNRHKRKKTSPEKGLWIVTLYLSTSSIKAKTIPNLELFDEYRLYTVDYSGKDKRWHILRMGFFPSESEALKVKNELNSTFPAAMVTKIEANEKTESKKHIIKPTGSPALGAPVGRTQIKLSKRQETRLKGQLKDAKKAMTRSRNKEAIRLLKKALKTKENKYSPEALELLGLAYERDGKTAKATEIYREYMTIYPSGEGRRRVTQRLAGLSTARDTPKKSFTRKRRSKDIRELYGTLSQFYNRDASYTDIDGSVLNRSSFSTDLDLSYRKRTADYETRAVFIGGYEHDFLGESEGRINRLYLDVLNRNNNVSGRVGRQWYSTGGVLGRFDGALLSFGSIPRIKINLVAGFPAESSTLSSVNTDKSLLGINLDLGTFWERWDFNVYAINQRVDGTTDRRAVGGEARYNDAKASYFSLVDYDIFFNRLNTFLLVANWMLPKDRTINISMDYRQSPSLSTTNALQGQTETSVADLLLARSEDEVHSLALDRTASNWSVSIGGSQPINTKFQLSGSVTVSELTGTDASGGVAAVQGTGLEYFYSLQLIANNILIKNDLLIAGLRYSDADTSNTTTASLNSRFSLKKNWRLNPRIQLDYSKNNKSSGSQFKIRPSMRTEYSWKKSTHLEFEGGLEWIYDRTTGSQTEYSRDYFIVTGYRMDF
ncbi:MAG: hypothetical protein ACE5DW_04470 [Thermodesulfobacteriota bacterium]